jgi:hypothetical protein
VLYLYDGTLSHRLDSSSDYDPTCRYLLAGPSRNLPNETHIRVLVVKLMRASAYSSIISSPMTPRDAFIRDVSVGGQ